MWIGIPGLTTNSYSKLLVVLYCYLQMGGHCINQEPLLLIDRFVLVEIEKRGAQDNTRDFQCWVIQQKGCNGKPAHTVAVKKQGEQWVWLFEQWRHIIVVVMDPVVRHAETPAHSVAPQVYQLDVKAIKSVLHGTLEVHIWVLSEPVHDGHGAVQLFVCDGGVSHICVHQEHFRIDHSFVTMGDNVLPRDAYWVHPALSFVKVLYVLTHAAFIILEIVNGGGWVAVCYFLKGKIDWLEGKVPLFWVLLIFTLPDLSFIWFLVDCAWYLLYHVTHLWWLISLVLIIWFVISRIVVVLVGT